MRLVGLEPTTIGFVDRSSIQLRYRRVRPEFGNGNLPYIDSVG